MLDELFNWLTLAMSETYGIALVAALGWGVISIILSPCHLSSIPLVVGYISSQGKEGARHSYLLSLVFALGILITIGLIGVITASAGRILGDVGMAGNFLVATVFFVVGLYFLDVISLSWTGFMPQTPLARGWRGALLLGLIFGIGLGPCTFAYMAPVLAVVFTMATTDIFQAILLIATFGIGHCTVIVAAGGAAGTVQRYLNWNGQSANAIRKTAGIFVLLGGVYFVYTAF
jgi:cytochrome c-type biogenesis protein